MTSKSEGIEEPDKPSSGAWGALAAILLVAFALRAYHLGVPSMWWDEIVAPLNARFPVSYIFAWCGAHEIHPPGFHLLLKLVLAFGREDWLLRAPSLLFGVAGCYALFEIGRRFLSVPAGLFAAAFLACNPLHVFMSRQTRPYSMLFFFIALSLLFMGELLRGGKAKSLAALLASNLVLTFTHYLSFFVLFAQGSTILLGRFFPGARIRLRSQILFFAGSAVELALILPFFLYAIGRRDMIGYKQTGSVFEKTVGFAAELVFFSTISR